MIPCFINMNDSNLWKTYKRATKLSLIHKKRTRTDGAINCGSFVLKSHLKWKVSGQRFRIPWLIDLNDSNLWKNYPSATQLSLNREKQTITDRIINCGSFVLSSHFKWKVIGQCSMISCLIEFNDSTLWKIYARATNLSFNHKERRTADATINCRSFLRSHLKWKESGQTSMIPLHIDMNDDTLGMSYTRATNQSSNHKKRTTTDGALNCGIFQEHRVESTRRQCQSMSTVPQWQAQGNSVSSGPGD